MPRKNKYILINELPAGIREGIRVGRISVDDLPNFTKVERPHRDNGHLLILQEKGVTHLGIDFQEYYVTESSVIHIHPSQVHQVINFENATISNFIITAENIQPDLLKILEDITPANILTLSVEALSVISEAASLCLNIYNRRQEKLYDIILKNSCNTFIALVLSQYLSQYHISGKHSRFDTITKAFKSLLDHLFTTIKSPAEYAKRLNISLPYLNECVKAATGHPVSWHIQARIILEAKRLLYHSEKSIKEIAGNLGYHDSSYFTRLFVKATGMAPVAFKNKNLE